MRTTHRFTLIATAALLALAAPTAGAALAKKAYFDVRITATQQVTWTKDVSTKDCGGGVTTITGKGSAWLKTSTATRPWVIAQRVPGPARATLQFAGRPGGAKAAGSYHREGDVTATSTSTSSGPNCGQSIPAAPDCGTVAVPRDAQLYLSYYSPAEWPFDSEPAPLVPSLVVTGPYSPEWTAPPFSFCQGINGDDWLGGTIPSTSDPIHTGPAPLPLSTLFGTRKSFKVTWSTRRTDDLLKVTPSPLSGTWPVTTSIHWTVRFTRRPSPPPLGAVDV